MKTPPEKEPFIHPLADVGCIRVGSGTKIWQFTVVLAGALIGEDCNICSHCFIEAHAIIGDRVTVKNGVSIWNGLQIEDDVFIGPGVIFTNDKKPVSRAPFESPVVTTIKRGARLGAGSIILPGVTIGEYAMVGAGAVVTKSVEAGSTVIGNPAKKMPDTG